MFILKLIIVDEHRLLLFDGHRSHLTAEFLEYCDQARIIPFAFIPHTTHVAQPLDGKPFLTYKQHFRRWNRRMTLWGGSVIDKGEFLEGIEVIRAKTFTTRIVRKSFAERGIWPFNPTIIIQPLLDAQPFCAEPTGFDPTSADARGELRTPSPGILSSSSIDAPTTPRSVRRSFAKAKRYLPTPTRPSLDPVKLKRRFERLTQYTVTEYEDSALKNTTIESFRTVRTKRTITRSKRQVSSHGILSIKNANRKINQRSMDENRKWVARVRRENAKKWQEEQENDNLTLQTSNSAVKEDRNALFLIDSHGDSSLRV